MNADIRDSLAQVVELLDKATPGTFRAAKTSHFLYGCSIYCDEDEFIRANLGGMFGPNQSNDAIAVAAAVNFLREHGPALLAVVEGRDE